jgi:hypothetical protein
MVWESYYLFIELKLIIHFARSYYKGIELGYLTRDPAAYHDPDVCAGIHRVP